MNKFRLSFFKQKQNILVSADGEPYFTAYAPVVQKQGYSEGDADFRADAWKNRGGTE